ncbi:MAG: trypsin-like peptidase domain-containing protein [Chloroflexi bacterium]|nr:trypsin-like peptidase domain-containing protein [Chloroflexota bacterium]
MRLTILVSLLVGLLAGVVGALVVTLALGGDDEETEQAVAALEAHLDRISSAQAVAAEAAALREDIQGLLNAVAPSVVLITTEYEDTGGSRGAVGTGVVLDDRGHVVTNAHIVRDASRIELSFADGSTRLAQLVGGDSPFTDVAVLRTDPAGLVPARFASSNDLRIGDPVLAFGNALGNDASLTRGVVSNPRARFFNSDSERHDYIQTDAPVNPGNSGGPLLDQDGSVVGIVTQVVTRTSDGQMVQGVGFALPSDRVLPVAERIIAEGGDFPRPDFGVVQQRSLDDFVAEQVGAAATEGALLVELLRSSVFADAGIRAGDIILSLNGFSVTPETPYFHVLQQLEPGQPVDVVYVDREGDERAVEVVPVRRRR